jgi:hypothetical protein
MIMVVTQRFRLYRPEGALAAEWVCAGCGAPMAEMEGDEQGVIMTHEEGCAEVQTATTRTA